MHTRHSLRLAAVALGAAVLSGPAAAVVTPPAGYIYTTQLLGSPTFNCIAAGPGGTFVGIGPFAANAQAIVLAKESGELRLVAMGFSSLSDCAYRPDTDTLYATDNADNADLDITTGINGNTGAQTGDTIYAISSASTATGLAAADLELLPADSIEFAANVTLDAAGDLFVANAAGGGAGTVVKITPGPMSATFVGSLNLVGGIAIHPTNGNVYVGENLGLPNFDNQLLRFTAAGAAIPPVPFAGPSFGFGSVDLLFNSDGRLLTSGNFGADVVSFDATTGMWQPFVSGFTFATGMTMDRFTERVQILSSTFTGADEDKSLHRFTPVDLLVAGSSKAASTCLQEFYGLALSGDDAVCVDGAACDADGKENDSCLFPIGFCFNVDDPDFAGCDPGTINEVEISAKPASTSVNQAAGVVADALPLSGSSCVFSDGYAVPVKITGSGKKDGKAKVKVKTSTADERKDSDVVKLICQPAP